MTLRLFFASTALAVTTWASASSLSPSEALSRVNDNRYYVSSNSAINTHFTVADLVYTQNIGQRPAAYIFSSPGKGFMILSADNAAEPVLAYGNNEIHTENIPANVSWWLNEYASEIAMADCQESAMAARPDREAIAPLCPVTWGQTSPFNDDCPTISGTPTLSGCVATAMAQIMKTHNYPSSGKGSNSYSWRGQTLSFDFGAHRFNWSLMNPSYTESSDDGTPESRKAVAELMYACGVSVDMQYGPYSSGASATRTASSMIRYFDYGSSTTMLDRSYFSLLDWETYIYRSLEKGAPVLYTGEGTLMAHAFVCDGYSADGYFHFNWGWNGDFDGYFLLSALTPGSYNTADKGFNKNQRALVNALPPNEGGKDPLAIFACTNSIKGSFDTSSSVLTLTGPYKYFGSMTAKCDFAIIVTDAEGNSKVYPDYSTNLVGYMGEVKQAKATIEDLEDGVYSVTAAVNQGGNGSPNDWMPVSSAPNIINSLVMTVADGQVSFSEPAMQPVVVSDFSLNTPLYFNRAFEIVFTAENPAEQDSEINYAVTLSNEDGEIWKSEVATESLGAFEKTTVTKQFTINAIEEDGDYTLTLCRVEKDSYVPAISIDVKGAVPPLGFDCTSTVIINNSDNIDPADFTINADIKMETGYFCYPIRASVYSADSDELISSYTETTAVFINEGEEKSVSLSLSFPTLKTGDYTMKLFAVMANLDNDYLPLIGSCPFKVGLMGVSTVSDMAVEFDGKELILAGPAEIRIINHQGVVINQCAVPEGTMHISLDTLPSGLYIIDILTKSEHITKKIAL